MTPAVNEFLRQYEDWVIASRRNGTWPAALRLTAQYVIIGATILIIFNTAVVADAISESKGLFQESEIISRTYATIVLERLMTGSFLLLAGIMAILGFAGVMLIRYAFVRIEQISHVQKRFISDASHEMRTPLAIVKTNIEIALMDKAGMTREEAIEAMESNLQEVNNITRIINALILLANFDDVTDSSPRQKINAVHVIRETAEAYGPLARDRGVTLRLPDVDAAYVRVDAEHLDLMFKQLLKNAITFTPSGGSVSVRVKHIFPKRVLFEIEDTGVGIHQRTLPHVFMPFYRAKGNHDVLIKETAPNPGPGEKPLGLGLTLVDRIVKRYRGTIYIQSELGKGTRVYVTFAAA